MCVRAGLNNNLITPWTQAMSAPQGPLSGKTCTCHLNMPISATRSYNEQDSQQVGERIVFLVVLEVNKANRHV